MPKRREPAEIQKCPTPKKMRMSVFDDVAEEFARQVEEEQIDTGPESMTNEELMRLKPEEIVSLRNFKKDAIDDMESLSHLDSAKSRVFERDHQTDEIHTGDVPIERFSSEAEETRRCERNPIDARKTLLQKLQEREVDDHWYHEYMEKQEDDSNVSLEAKLDRAARDAKRKANEDKMDDDDLDSLDQAQVYRRLSSLLQDEETVAGALRRLSGMKNTSTKRNQARKKSTETTISKADQAQIEKITELATLCMARRYFPDIYSVSREQLLQQLGQASMSHTSLPFHSRCTLTAPLVDESNKNSDQWEYKTSADESNVFGPFDTQAILAWKEQVSD